MEESIEKVISKETAKETCMNPYQYSPLALAYIGDSVFDLLVKTHFVLKKNMQAEKYHKAVTEIVKAKSQAKFVEEIKDSLTEDELDIYKRGRNQTTHSKAKNASMSEYRRATGFEALVGYLYLSGKKERLDYLMDRLFAMFDA